VLFSEVVGRKNLVSCVPEPKVLQVTGIKNPNTGMRNLYGKMSVGV